MTYVVNSIRFSYALASWPLRSTTSFSVQSPPPIFAASSTEIACVTSFASLIGLSPGCLLLVWIDGVVTRLDPGERNVRIILHGKRGRYAAVVEDAHPA